MKLALPRDATQYIIPGPYTFRTGSKKILSSKRDGPLVNAGGNRQNLRKMMRMIWLSDPGCLLGQVDQAGAEALIVAYLCRAAKYRSLFQNGIKPHTYLALKLFPDVWAKHRFGEERIKEAISVPIPELPKLSFWKDLSNTIKDSDNWSSNERFYHFAKKTIHAGTYGMRENTFRVSLLKESGGTINFTFDQAKYYLVGFHTEFPEIQEWHVRIFETAKRFGVLRNLLGYPYHITDYINPDDFKDLIAWIPQSTVASITRQAVVRWYDYKEEHKRDWMFLQETHDSFMCQAEGKLIYETKPDGREESLPTGDILECARVMKNLIEIEMTSPFDGSKFRMKSEAQVGGNWAPRRDYKDEAGIWHVKNREGLVEVKL